MLKQNSTNIMTAKKLCMGLCLCNGIFEEQLQIKIIYIYVQYFITIYDNYSHFLHFWN